MSRDNKTLASDPFAWIFRASLLLLGASIALNVAVSWLRPIAPWLATIAVTVAVGWVAAAIIRWRRSRY